MFSSRSVQLATRGQFLHTLRKRRRGSLPRCLRQLQDDARQNFSSVSDAKENERPSWLQKLQDDPMDTQRFYEYLNLVTFTDAEFQDVFRSIQLSTTAQDVPGGGIDAKSINLGHFTAFLEERIGNLEESNDYNSQHSEATTETIRTQFAAVEAKRCWEFLSKKGSMENNQRLTMDEFSATIKNVASSLDTKRVWPLTLSMILVGASVGVVAPAMPFVVQDLGLSAGEYGLVVSAFALSKMTGNIPSAVLVERHGRKPYLVYSMAAVAIGVGGIGLASSFEHLYLCRLATGLGVAGLSTAVTMTVTDISTPLNRASSFAPIMSAFSAGTALGPALGGILCDQIGINPTFYVVGVSYFGLAAINNFLLNETKPTAMTFQWQEAPKGVPQQTSISESFQSALGQWMPLLSMRPVRNVCIMNGFYWMALAGSQMTLLPLILTDVDGFAMTATNVGQVYMGMSLVQVLGNPILAKAVDKVGKVPGIVGGCTLISVGMASLPFCNDIYQMAGVLGVWAVGSTLLSTSPISYISDKVDDKKRAQAIALLRTSGDVGFLVGASSMGALADYVGSLEVAMQSSSAILLAATGWFAARNILTAQLEKQDRDST